MMIAKVTGIVFGILAAGVYAWKFKAAGLEKMAHAFKQYLAADNVI